MKDYVPIEKDGDRELPIPTLWREEICEIVDVLSELSSRVPPRADFLADVSEEVFKSIDANLAEYGCRIDPASASMWNTSICRWMGGYWHALIDLFSEGEQTDLVLFLRVTESGGKYLFRIESVHVP